MTWETVPLTEVVSLQRGHDLPTTQRGLGSVPVVGSAGVSGFHDVAKCGAPGLVIGRSGASIGKATFVPEPFWPLNTGLFATSFHGNDAFWVYLAITQLDLAQLNSGSAQPSLNRNNLAGVMVRRPPLPTQRAIAEVLGALDDKIAANQRVVASASNLMAAEGAGLAVGSRVVALSELATSAKEQVQPSSMGVVAHFSLPAFDEGQWPAVDSGESIMSAKLRVRSPSVLMARLNPRIPRLWEVPTLPDPPAVASTEFMVLEPRGVPTGALWSVLAQSTVMGRLQELARGTSGSHQRVRPEEALAIEVPDAREFTGAQMKMICSLSDRRHAARVESRALANLRDTLLPHLMSGRITVREAEGLLEGAGC